MSSSTRDGGEKHFKGLTKYFMWLVLCCVVLCSGDVLESSCRISVSDYYFDVFEEELHLNFYPARFRLHEYSCQDVKSRFIASLSAESVRHCKVRSRLPTGEISRPAAVEASCLKIFNVDCRRSSSSRLFNKVFIVGSSSRFQLPV